MANRDRLYGNDTGFVTLFARAPQLCAAALAGLASALCLNVVGPFAGLVAAWGALMLVNALAIAVVAILAMLVTTAGTLLAADWRAEAAARQACAGIDVAAAELRLPAQSVAPSLVDPRYLTATAGEALPSVFRTHHPASLAPVVERGSQASCVTRIVMAARRPISPVATSEAAPRKAASASLGQEFLLVASGRAPPQAFRAGTAAVTTRLVANAALPERLAYHRSILTRAPPDRRVADIIVLNGDQSDRYQSARFHGPSTGDGAPGKSDELPSCRERLSVTGQPSRPTKAVSVQHLSENPREVPVAHVQQSANSIVRDNFGHHVPVCSAELEVIETYLDPMLQGWLGRGASASDREKS